MDLLNHLIRKYGERSCFIINIREGILSDVRKIEKGPVAKNTEGVLVRHFLNSDESAESDFDVPELSYYKQNPPGEKKLDEPTAMDWVKSRTQSQVQSAAKILTTTIRKTQTVTHKPDSEQILPSKPETSSDNLPVSSNTTYPKSAGLTPKHPIRNASHKARILEDQGSLRVHRDREASELAEEAGAKALTIGKDIYLGAGVSDLESAESKGILAHEMKHVEQFTTPQEPGREPEALGYGKLESEAKAAEETENLRPQNEKPQSGELFHSIATQLGIPAETEKLRNAGISTRFPSPEIPRISPMLPRGESLREMNHPRITISGAQTSASSTHSAPQTYMGGAMPVMKAPLDDGEAEEQSDDSGDDAVQASLFSGGRFAKLKRRIRQARKKEAATSAPGIDTMADEIYERIKERLIVERERFEK